MPPRISAIIATRNRATYLRKAIESLGCQTLNPGLYEIIVVDNGSQDNTKQVVEEFAALPNLRYFFEPVPGCSRARNTGWKNAQGEIIAFMDDDAIAHPEWLARYISAFDHYGASAGSIGGKVELIWEAPKPAWLSPRLLGILSVYHYSDEMVVLNQEQWLSICNLAYPSEVLKKANGLREDLGRQGDNLRASAENFLRQQTDDWGLVTVYHPDILVHHHIPSSRLTKKWFKNAAFWQGKSEAIMLYPVGRPSAVKEKLILSIKKIIWIMPRFVLMLVAIDPAERFRRWFQIVEASGFIAGLFSKNE
jgi:glycosyltransferase involved in cell wall biosynthesis